MLFSRRQNTGKCSLFSYALWPFCTCDLDLDPLPVYQNEVSIGQSFQKVRAQTGQTCNLYKCRQTHRMRPNTLQPHSQVAKMKLFDNCWVLLILFPPNQMNVVLTPWTPAVLNCCCSKGSAPYWSNPPFLISDIRALWRSVLSARAPECQKLKMVG